MGYIGREPTYGLFEKQFELGNGTTTTWSLDHAVSTSSSILVSVAGVIQEPEYSYSISGGGTEIEFLEAPPNNARIYIVFLGEKMYSPVTSVDDGAVTRAKLDTNVKKYVPEWYATNSAETLEVGKYYVIDTSVSSFTVTLPSAPTFGDMIRILDGTGSFSTNNLIINGGTELVMGETSLTVATNNAALGLVYYNSTYGWRLLEV